MNTFLLDTSDYLDLIAGASVLEGDRAPEAGHQLGNF